MLKNKIKSLISLGLNINVVYDIGAWKGYWSLDMRDLLNSSQFYLFEGNETYKDDLDKTHMPYFIEILSNKVQDVQYYRGAQSGESYYKENTNYYKNVLPEGKISNTLDNIITTNNLPLPDFIKIDTQGSELDILSGGFSSLNNASLVYSESPVLQYNNGAPSFDEYIQFFLNKGFYPLDICEQHYMDSVLVQMDILFIKKEIKNKILGTNNILLV
jgi:FkbM family methyltransferase